MNQVRDRETHWDHCAKASAALTPKLMANAVRRANRVFVNLANGAWIVLPNEVVIEQLDSFVLDGWKPDNAWMCDTETGDPLLSVQPGQAYDLYL